MKSLKGNSLITLLLFFCCACSNFIAIAKAQAFVAQVTQSGPALSPFYLASNISIGTPPQLQQLLIATDAASYSWVKCGRRAPFDPSKSSSFRYATCNRRQPCYEHLQPYNISGRFAEDIFSMRSTNGSSQRGLYPAGEAARFACTEAEVGALGFAGVASLTGSKAGLPAQLGVTKFAYCLPSSASDLPTPLFLGEGIMYLFGGAPLLINVASFLVMAKLKVHAKTGYFSVVLHNLRISSVERYTKLSHRLYSSMRSQFRAKAAERGMERVQAQSPFDTCFNTSSFGWSRTGPSVPDMELHVEGVGVGSTVAWVLSGFNSIVSVSESVSCWPFLDAGVRKPSVLGSFQQERHLLEFDLLNKTVGYTPVLDGARITCSTFNF